MCGTFYAPYIHFHLSIHSSYLRFTHAELKKKIMSPFRRDEGWGGEAIWGRYLLIMHSYGPWSVYRQQGSVLATSSLPSHSKPLLSGKEDMSQTEARSWFSPLPVGLFTSGSSICGAESQYSTFSAVARMTRTRNFQRQNANRRLDQ